MKVLLLVTGGRGGSDFFQGLLDGHQEIIQFPGILRPNKKFKEIFLEKKSTTIAHKFLNYAPNFFDSSQESHERHNQLGKRRNQSYSVNKKKFIEQFEKLYKKKFDNFETLKLLHKAYYLAANKKIKNLKILFIHTHTVKMTREFLNIINIPNFNIIHTMRNPIEALYSPIKNWLNFKGGSVFFSKDLFFQIDLAFNGISDLLKINKKTYLILLESLIKDKKKVMQDFCKTFKINFSSRMLNCTYFGLQWWGDSVSGRWIGKSEKKIRKKINLEKYFFQRDINYVKTLSLGIIQNYYSKNSLSPKKLIKINFFPLKSEILVWKNSFKHARIKHIVSIPYFYIKRVLLINKFFVKNNVYPRAIGEK